MNFDDRPLGNQYSRHPDAVPAPGDPLASDASDASSIVAPATVVSDIEQVSTFAHGLAEVASIDRIYQALDPRDVQVSRVVALIISIVLGVAALVGIVLAGFGAGFSVLWMSASAGGVLLLSLLIAFLFCWPSISHRHVRWRLDQVGLEIQRGVFWKRTISVPLARLQHADLTQGPLQRQWGLAKLTVYTAGTQHASVELDGLAYETAATLRDRLLRQQGVGDVV
ncbi:MAG: PH domain-containing protein [Pirellulaceae bacterium]|nr:PH domain-containing protein [Pirellulaceae bacterium]